MNTYWDITGEPDQLVPLPNEIIIEDEMPETTSDYWF